MKKLEKCKCGGEPVRKETGIIVYFKCDTCGKESQGSMYPEDAITHWNFQHGAKKPMFLVAIEDDYDIKNYGPFPEIEVAANWCVEEFSKQGKQVTVEGNKISLWEHNPYLEAGTLDREEIGEIKPIGIVLGNHIWRSGH